jgi:uncharacterized protein (TIGR02300 family)
MTKAELGEKRRCLSCNTPFFDLQRTPIVCPKCAAVFQVVELFRSPGRYAPARPAPFKRPAPAPLVAADEVLLVEDEEEDAESVVSPAELDDEIEESEAI